MYLSLEQHVSDGKLSISSPSELSRLHSLPRDFTSLLQLVGRLSSLFVGEDFLARIEEGSELVKQLILLASQGTRTKFYAMQGLQPDLIKDFVDVQAHSLAALKAWCHWLAMLHTASLKNPSYESQCRELTSRVTLAAVTVVKEGGGAAADKSAPSSSSSVLVHSAVHFLVTLTGTVRPPSIWKLKEFTDLYAGAQRLSLSPEDNRLLVRSLANVLLLHWPGLSEQRWEERQKHLAKFLRDVTKDFRDVRSAHGFQHSLGMQKMGAFESASLKTIALSTLLCLFQPSP